MCLTIIQYLKGRDCELLSFWAWIIFYVPRFKFHDNRLASASISSEDERDSLSIMDRGMNRSDDAENKSLCLSSGCKVDDLTSCYCDKLI